MFMKKKTKAVYVFMASQVFDGLQIPPNGSSMSTSSS